jgi:hypothetical protein
MRCATAVQAGTGGNGFNDGPGDEAIFMGPKGLAVVESTGEVLVSDFFNSRIRAVGIEAGNYYNSNGVDGCDKIRNTAAFVQKSLTMLRFCRREAVLC